MSEFYNDYIIHVWEFDSDCWAYKIIMTIEDKKKNIHSRGSFSSKEIALQKAKAYVDEFGKERMKRGFVLNGKRIYPSSH